MGVATGYKQNLYWANESLYGSSATIDKPFGLVQSINPTETNNLIKIRTLGGNRDYSNIVPGKFEISGSFEYYLQDGIFLRQAFGEDTASSATIDSGPKFHTGNATTGFAYFHTLGSAASPEADNFPSFCMEFADEEDTGAMSTTNNLKRVYDGCRVNTLGLSGTIDEPLRINCDFIAQGVTVSTAAATSVTDLTKDPYIFYQGIVTATSGNVVGDTVVLAADQIAEVNGFDFNINNNLEAIWYISGTTSTHQTLRGLKKLIVKGRDYDANLNLHFSTREMYQRFLGSNTATEDQATLSKYQIALDFVRVGDVGGVKTESDDFIRIVLGSCAFNSINIPGAPEDIVSQTLDLSVEHAKCYIVDSNSNYS